jgi:formylglycine-generating enzyme required for sulfatase activity
MEKREIKNTYIKGLILSALVLVISAHTSAQTRGFVLDRKEAKDHIALVIGNSDYPDMPLANPVNDAIDVAKTFEEIGFVVETVLDADKEQMARAIDRFSRKMSRARAAVFYFAGHGMQVDGQNYLIPVARNASGEIYEESQVSYRAINAGEVLSSMESKKVKFAMVVLDACRNNPIKGSGRGKLKGLAAIDAPVGSLVMYATKAGDVASDGIERNSPFTAAFLEHIATPGLDVNLLPSKVTNTVHQLTGGEQTPGTYVQLTESFTFVPAFTEAELKALKEKQRQLEDELWQQKFRNEEERRKRQAEYDKLLEEINKVENYDEDLAEIAERQAEIEALDKKLEDMKKQSVEGVDNLDAMLKLIEDREKRNDELEALKRKKEEERKRKEKELADKKRLADLEKRQKEKEMLEIKLREYASNMSKYNKIANSKFGKDLKVSAWKAVLKNLDINKNIPLDDSLTLQKELGFFITSFSVNVAGLSIAMQGIQGGNFQMGSTSGDEDEQPIHSVSLDSYALSKYEVSNAEFCVFLNEKGNQTEGDRAWIKLDGNNGNEKCRIYKSGSTYKVESGYERHPVIYVSWYAARAYCAWLSEKTGQEWRLPTEAEWEYASRAGENHKYAGSSNIDEVAWYTKTTKDSGTKAVGTKKANAFGLYDMSGNVWEWCSDLYGEYKNGEQSNPQGATSGFFRVIRGGDWNGSAYDCRVAYRSSFNASNRDNSIGFRPCLSL